MLTILGRRRRSNCDGLPRRDFLKIGGCGIAGLSLTDLLRAESRAGRSLGHKGLIHVFLSGGPPHTDMFDMKPNAAPEYRGELRPVATNVPGIEICELMPRLAEVADKYTIVRSIFGADGAHSAFNTQTGYTSRDLKGVGGRPSIGSVVSKLHESTSTAPPFVSMYGSQPFGYLGPTHGPYSLSVEDMERGTLPGLTLGAIAAGRIRDRLSLLKKMDSARRRLEASGAADAMDVFTERAAEMVLSGRVAKAVDLEDEDPQVRKLYGRRDMGPYGQYMNNEHFLIARRLIEAGVRVVAVKWFGWDTHETNFRKLRRMLPVLDAGLAGLFTDLYDRGLDKDVTVIVWGEFGRTPKINAKAGRDHWPKVMQALVSGGGMKTGQIVGATDRTGGEAIERPVHLHEMFATLYRNLGIDVTRTTITDPAGRPQYLVDGHEPVRELG